MKTFLSLGAGVQSSTLALMLAKNQIEGVSVDAAIFADTGNEPQSVYNWLSWLKEQLPYPVHIVSAGNLGEDSLILRQSKTSGRTYLKTFVPYHVKKNDGTKGMMMRKCTADYKVRVIERFVKKLVGPKIIRDWNRQEKKEPGQEPLVKTLMGISIDEAHRMKQNKTPWIVNDYPLVTYFYSRVRCLEWMMENGYPRPPRSACVFCPYHSDAEWKRLKEKEPLEFERAIRWERNVRQNAKFDETIEGEVFLHASLKPLDQVEFKDSEENEGWGNECEGMCGI